MPTDQIKDASSNLWQKIGYNFRKYIYPRVFDVTLVDSQTGEHKNLKFKSLDKTEMSGRFFGDCQETIIVDHNDFERMYGGVKHKAKNWLKNLFGKEQDTQSLLTNARNQRY